jgi:hypothetical protein
MKAVDFSIQGTQTKAGRSIHLLKLQENYPYKEGTG